MLRKTLLHAFCWLLVFTLACQTINDLTPNESLREGDPVATPVVEGQSRAHPFAAGTTATKSGWRVTVLDSVRGQEAWTLLRETHPNNDPPLPGMEYLLLQLQLEDTDKNGSDTHFNISVTGENAIIYHWFAYHIVRPEPWLEVDVPDGESSQGWLAYQVGVGEEKLQLMLSNYDDSGDDRYRFLALAENAALMVPESLADLEPGSIGRNAAEPALFGQMVVTEDWEVDVKQALRGDEAWDRLLETNQFNDPPPPGREYVLVEVAVRYLGVADKHVHVDNYYFAASGDSGRIFDKVSVVNPEPDLDISLFPGGSYTGWITVAVPEKETGIMLLFTPQPYASSAPAWYLSLQTTGR